jgi:hypothetical protein
MKNIIVLLAVLSSIVLVVAGFSSGSKTRIGVFDSRAIAIAHANSSEGAAVVAELRAEMEKAKTAKNDAQVKVINEKGKMHQVLGHLRAFSVGSVAEILEKHKSDIAQIAKKAGVEAIVSKFETPYLGSGIETVDVTQEMVGMFKTSEQGKKWAADISNHAPMPMLEVLTLPDDK